MSETATLNVRMDADTKREFTAICEELGISASSLMNVFARMVVRNQGVPFPLSVKTRAGDISQYRRIFPQSEEEIFEAIDAGAKVPLDQCYPAAQGEAFVRERLGW